MYVDIFVGRYKKFQIILIHGGDRFVRGLSSPQYRRLNGFVREDVELATYGRYLCGRHDVTEKD